MTWREFDEKAHPTTRPGRLTAGFGNKQREIPLIPGSRYRIEPLNPKKLKHRGRMCVLIQYDAAYFDQGQVRWEDTKRIGQVELSDLLLIEAEGRGHG